MLAINRDGAASPTAIILRAVTLQLYAIAEVGIFAITQPQFKMKIAVGPAVAPSRWGPALTDLTSAHSHVSAIGLTATAALASRLSNSMRTGLRGSKPACLGRTLSMQGFGRSFKRTAKSFQNSTIASTPADPRTAPMLELVFTRQLVSSASDGVVLRGSQTGVNLARRQ